MQRFAVIATIVLAACTTTQAPRELERPAPVERRPWPALAQIEASADLDGAPVGASDHTTMVVVFASWCTHCKHELALIGDLRAAHPGLRVLGVNVKAHEEYADRGSAAAVRAYVADHAPWLRVVPADDALFTALGRPPKVPTIYVFDRRGALIETYDRRTRALPDAAELDALLRRLDA